MQATSTRAMYVDVMCVNAEVEASLADPRIVEAAQRASMSVTAPHMLCMPTHTPPHPPLGPSPPPPPLHTPRTSCTHTHPFTPARTHAHPCTPARTTHTQQHTHTQTTTHTSTHTLTHARAPRTGPARLPHPPPPPGTPQPLAPQPSQGGGGLGPQSSTVYLGPLPGVDSMWGTTGGTMDPSVFDAGLGRGGLAAQVGLAGPVLPLTMLAVCC